jgi:hypothetical protein
MPGMVRTPSTSLTLNHNRPRPRSQFGLPLSGHLNVKAVPDVDINSEMILGENERPAFLKTDSACLDLFFSVVPGTEVLKLRALLMSAWGECPQITLRIIFHLGNVRGGKQDRVNYYRSLAWLYEHHPSTFFLNIKEVPKHSCLKCLLNLLMFFTHPDSERYGLEGSLQSIVNHEAHKLDLRNTWQERSAVRRRNQLQLRQDFAATLGPLEIKLVDNSTLQVNLTFPQLRIPKAKDLKAIEPAPDADDIGDFFSDEKPYDPLVKSEWVSQSVATLWNSFIKNRDETWANKCKTRRRELQAAVDTDVRARLSYECSPATPLKRLYSEVADIFAKGITDELKAVEKGARSLGGLFGKWAPTPKGMHDKATRISEGIAARLHAQGRLGEPLADDIDSDVARSILLDRYRKVLSKLRGIAKVPEHFVGSGSWANIDYNRMASRCRLIFGEKVFARHDSERYNAFLKECELAALEGDGSKGPSVKSGVLLPHEVTEAAVEAHGMESSATTTANLQWRGLVEACAASGAAQQMRIVPVCDVSGSMEGRPMEVAVALSLLLAESAPLNSPWHGKIFTFSQIPLLVEVPGIPAYSRLKAGAEGVQSCNGSAPVDSELTNTELDGKFREEEQEEPTGFSHETRNDNASGACDAVEEADTNYGNDASGPESASTEDDESVTRDVVKVSARALGNLAERVHFVKGLNPGFNTDVDAVFDLVLKRLTATRTTPEEVKRTAVVIFSDMEFDLARGSVDCPWPTAHQSIKHKFLEAGYEHVPVLIYWNLRDSISLPVGEGDTPGVLLLSGYSAGMVRSFLQGNLDDMTPVKQMEQMLERGIYRKLRVAEEDMLAH